MENQAFWLQKAFIAVPSSFLYFIFEDLPRCSRLEPSAPTYRLLYAQRGHRRARVSQETEPIQWHGMREVEGCACYWVLWTWKNN